MGIDVSDIVNSVEVDLEAVNAIDVSTGWDDDNKTHNWIVPKPMRW